MSSSLRTAEAHSGKGSNENALILETADALRRSVAGWLERMASGLEPGRFRFCRRGSLVPAKAQFATCFAVKSASHMGLWREWDETRRRASIEHIRSFQRPDGNFVDEAMQKRFRLGASIDRLRGRRGAADMPERIIAAETRQSAATLLLAGEKPRYALPVAQQTPDDVRQFVRTRDWSLPWDAGSHTSHLIFFLHTNAVLGSERAAERIDAAFEELDAVRDIPTGTWFRGDVSPQYRINGAMKVLTAYAWTGHPLSHAERLLDTALDAKFGEDGCSFLNRLFVVQQAKRHCGDYREADTRALAVRCFERALAFRKPDGAFSFLLDGAQRRYYDAYTSLGGAQSDLHGTVMLTWAVAICLELLGLSDVSGWSPSTP